MNKLFAIALLLCAFGASGDDRRFVAADVRSKPLSNGGRIVISNDKKSISAYRFFGEISEALVKLRATQFSRQTQPLMTGTIQSAGPLTDLFNDAAREHGIDARLLAAVARRESRGNPNAVSPVGACGVMQLMPATARFLGVKDVFDPRQNVFAGAHYLRTLLDTFNGDLDLTLAAYNAGPGAVQKYHGVPPYRETREYVASIRTAYARSIAIR
ncbi:MAG: lytic transglycosylase domain-containing protein [Thermoanaerobaculia bacterium]